MRRKKNFERGSGSSNLGLALGMAVSSNSKVARGLNLKVSKFWGMINSGVWRSHEEKTVKKYWKTLPQSE